MMCFHTRHNVGMSKQTWAKRQNDRLRFLCPKNRVGLLYHNVYHYCKNRTAITQYATSRYRLQLICTFYREAFPNAGFGFIDVFLQYGIVAFNLGSSLIWTCEMSLIGIYAFNLQAFYWLTNAADHLKKDTVLVPFLVLRWTWHVEQDQVWITGFPDDGLIELHRRMHPPHIGMVATSNQRS